jgi:PTH1 family peptidyl-tRNA hydrolase
VLLLVGLGNPGSGYARNRHNIGFMAVDAIVHRHSFAPFRSKFQGELSEGKIGTEKVLVLKPMTYMNESGRSIQAVMAFYKITPEDILVFHDEMDLAAGKIRIKRGGGHGGHNGIRSVHAHVGPNCGRIRIGVGHPGTKEKVVGHVLKDFAKADQDWLDKLIPAMADEVGYLVKGDDAGFMNRVALVMNPPRPKPERKTEDKDDK